MSFTPDTVGALQSAAELVNAVEPPVTLTTVADLEAFFRRHGYTGRHDRTADEVAAVLALAPRLRALLLADRDAVAPLVNAMLAEVGAVPRLVRHEHEDWHLHAVDDDAPLADRILAETAMAMVDVVRADEHSRLDVCADAGCSGVVLDLSRNRSRRYCSVTCTNRNAQAAHRARRAGAA
ncbi:CGNR zinc finger domain-containing protein [Isoptericola sp. S6320L]|uniref:CGNR zinc finger domain-containing protein n=1 Tax=Isoptericola sp. S6320L TaxID=2926411 RepID=UPI001FF1C79C|nr:CGNR zinc finger domain-containing protein [Isoptericola sp. S6320L]MCK0117978.1 CGNR zinc finger domain-containing protein [Isoptericola sp. S6320L]